MLLLGTAGLVLVLFEGARGIVDRLVEWCDRD